MSAGPSVEPDPLDGSLLLAIARDAVAERFGREPRPIPPHPWLQRPAATFVTLTRHEPGAPSRGQLRGCIGSVEPRRPLVEDLRHNAVMAAFHDPRFRPLRSDELAQIRYAVSILGRPEPLEFTSEADARAKLRPGVDGLILTYHGDRGLFLPQVWDALPDPREFLDQLKRKAGLPTDFWRPDLRLDRFEVLSFHEPAPR